MSIHERVKQVRLLYDLSQKEFGEKINIKSRAHISALESGTRTVTERIINDICRVYGISKKWLLTGEGDMRAEETAFIEAVVNALGRIDPLDKQIITAYLRLDDKCRAAFREFLKGFLAQLETDEQ